MTISKLREALLEARHATVHALNEVDAALKLIDVAEGLRIAPAHGSMKVAIQRWMQGRGPVSSKDVAEALATIGFDVKANSVNQTLYRMAKKGEGGVVSTGRLYEIRKDGEEDELFNEG